ncbi:hypothetical protein AC579_3803 [Pseudocercospora musae]|uniref:F-box domain-containing protein n=1 Tax=Pseudocercospora musae TaxID=113226 RepID=A0A139I070_9PEZI|nr:hypothetical protein AC579_3803 [Pseudocercospora musae]
MPRNARCPALQSQPWTIRWKRLHQFCAALTGRARSSSTTVRCRDHLSRSSFSGITRLAAAAGRAQNLVSCSHRFLFSKKNLFSAKSLSNSQSCHHNRSSASHKRIIKSSHPKKATTSALNKIRQNSALKRISFPCKRAITQASESEQEPPQKEERNHHKTNSASARSLAQKKTPIQASEIKSEPQEKTPINDRCISQASRYQSRAIKVTATTEAIAKKTSSKSHQFSLPGFCYISQQSRDPRLPRTNRSHKTRVRRAKESHRGKETSSTSRRIAKLGFRYNLTAEPLTSELEPQKAHSKMESPKLDMLPTELFDMVADLLSPADLPALRLVSRDTEWRVRRTYAEKCFGHLEVLLNSERSLKKALEISVVGGKVHTLTIHLDELAACQHAAKKQKQKQLQQDVHHGSTKQDDIHVPQRKVLFEILTKNAKTLTAIRLRSGSPPLHKMDWSNNKSKAYRVAASQALHAPKSEDRRAFAIVVGAMADALNHDPESYNITHFGVEKCDQGWSFPLHDLSTNIAGDTVKSWPQIQTHLKSLEMTMDFTPGNPIDLVDLSAAARAFGTNMPNLDNLTLNVARSPPHMSSCCLSNFPMLMMLYQARLSSIKTLRLRNAAVKEVELGAFLEEHEETIEKVVLEGCCLGGGVQWIDRKEEVEWEYVEVEVVA